MPMPSVQQAHEPDSSPSSCQPEHKLPELIRHYISAWPRYIALMRDAESTIERLKTEEGDVRGHPGRSGWTWDPLHRQYEYAFARDVGVAICQHARETLCGGNTIVLSDLEIDKLVSSTLPHGKGTPDFAALWREVERRFGNGLGHARNRVQVARELRRELGIYRADQDQSLAARREVKREREGFTFKLYLTMLSHSHKGHYEIQHGSADRLLKLARQIALLLEDKSVADEVRSMVEALRGQPLSPPLRVDRRGWRWTFLKDASKVWMPESEALEVRARIEELDPPDVASNDAS